MTIGQAGSAGGGALVGALLAAPTGGMSLGMGAFIGGAIGSSVGGALFPPKERTQVPASLNVQTSQSGLVIPVVYGEKVVTGNCIWYGNFKKITNSRSSGKGINLGSQTVNAYYTYTCSFAFALAANQCDLVEIRASDRPIETTMYSSGRFYDGQQTTPDPHIQAILGGTRHPVWKGLVYVVFENWNLGTTPTVPIITAKLRSYSLLPLVSTFGSYGTGDSQFKDCFGITVDSNYIYTTDSTNNRVQIFNKTNNAYVGQFGSYGSTDGLFNDPRGIAVDSSYIYVSDAGNTRFQVFNKTSPYAFVGKKTVGTVVGGVTGMAIDSNYIYTSERSASGGDPHRVQIFNIASPYNFVATFGSFGDGTGQLNSPYNLQVDNSNIFVAEYGSSKRVQVFNKTSPYASVRSYTEPSYSPLGLAIDNYTIYTTLYSNHNIRTNNLISPYKFINSLGSYYNSPDRQFYTPSALAVDNDYIYISDRGNSRIKVFKKDFNIESTPNDIVRDALTNSFYGLKLSSSFIDDTSFESVRTYNITDDMRISALVDKQQSILDFLQYILMHHNGLLTCVAGKIYYRQLSESMSASDTLTSAAFVKQQGVPFIEVTDKGEKEYFNKVTIQYTKEDGTVGTTFALDMADIDANGLKDTLINLNGLNTYNRANKMAQRLLNKSISNPKSITGIVGINNYDKLASGKQINITDVGTELSSKMVTIVSLTLEDNYTIKLSTVEEIIKNYDVSII